MKKPVIVVFLALFTAAVMVVAGCGSSNSDTTKPEETLGVDTGPMETGMEVSVTGTFESSDGNIIVLKADGTFETDAWDGMKEGAYVVIQDEMGKWVELSFDDGYAALMSVMIAMDEVAAIVDDGTLVQYTKK